MKQLRPLAFHRKWEKHNHVKDGKIQEHRTHVGHRETKMMEERKRYDRKLILPLLRLVTWSIQLVFGGGICFFFYRQRLL